MDEDNTVQAENTAVAEDSNVETSPVTETNTSAETETNSDAGEETQVTEPAAEETPVEAERKPSRAERKIRQQAAELKRYRSQQNQLPPSFQPSQGAPQFDIRQFADEEGNIDPNAVNQALSQNFAQAAQSIVAPQLDNLRGEFETKEALRNFDADMELIEAKYPELTEESPRAQALEEAITEAYQEKAYRLVGFDPVTGQPEYRIDPSVRLSDIAAKEVERARLYAQQASADMKNAVAAQADNAALKPGASVQSERAFKDLSIEEMEAQLGVVRQ